MEDINDFRKEFEEILQERCVDNSCENEEDTYDYPDYVAAMYEEVMPPVKSGVYFSRWDLKMIGDAIDASIAMDTRERMFKMLMRSIHSKESMEKVLDAFAKNMDDVAKTYEALKEAYPASAKFFEEKLEKIDATKGYFDEILERYFVEDEE